MAHEIELKLSFPRQALAQVRAHPLITAAPADGPARTLANVYYDTPGHKLQRNRIGVRVRSYGRTHIQTVKCAASSTAGLSARPEWNQPFAGAFDFSNIDDAALRARLERFAPRLAPCFTTRFKRETRVYAPRENLRILIMIDHGEILAGQASEPIHELELELEQGEPADLLRLAAQLTRDLPLTPEDNSKAARGYRLHAGATQAVTRAEKTALTPDMAPLEAFNALALASLRHWQGNLPTAALSDPTAARHQLRVAQRRLRALITLYTPLLPTAFVRKWEPALRNHAAPFSAVRDLDVLAGLILASVRPVADDDRAACDALRHTVATERGRCHDQLPDADTQGAQLLDFMLDLHKLPRSHSTPASLVDFAHDSLTLAHERLARHHADMREDQPASLHAARIAVRQLRYTLEFFAPILPSKRCAREQARLAKIQRALGFVHDVDVARERLLALAGRDAQLRAAAYFTCGWHAPARERKVGRAMTRLDRLLAHNGAWA